MYTNPVREAKGEKDRVTLLPALTVDALKEHLIRVRQQHERALREGYAGVELPYTVNPDSNVILREFSRVSASGKWKRASGDEHLRSLPASISKPRLSLTCQSQHGCAHASRW